MKTLIIVDYQNDFCSEHRPLSIPKSLPALWNTADFLQNNDIDNVVFTVDWHIPNHPSFEENGGIWPKHCVAHSEGAAISQLLLDVCAQKNIPYEVIPKATWVEEYGAFNGSHLESFAGEVALVKDVPGGAEDSVVLWANDDDEIIICGLAGDYCVLHTIINLKAVWDNLQIYLPGIASIDGGKALNEFIAEHNLKVITE